MMRSASPAGRARKGQMSPTELEEKVVELERYKREEQQEKAREQARRKRELLGARRQLQREIKKTTQEVRARAAEVEAIERTVLKVADAESRFIDRQTQANQRYEARVGALESKTAQKSQFLQERMQELGLARGRLSHLEFLLKGLDEGTITHDAVQVAAFGGGGDAGSAPAPAQLQHASAPHGPALTAALRQEAEELRSQARRLERENGMLHEELKEVRRIFDMSHDDLQPARDATAMSGVDTEASRAEPAPEPPASMSRVVSSTSFDGSSPSTTAQLRPMPAAAAQPLFIPAASPSWQPLTAQLPQSPLASVTMPASTIPYTTATVASGYPVSGLGSPSTLRSWTWGGGGLPVVA